MSLVEKLLAFLPPEIKVANCMHCGSLCTRNVASARAFAKYGLKLWSGMQFDARTGNMRPLCNRCHLYTPRPVVDGIEHRSPGQAHRLSRFLEEEERKA